MKQLTPIGTLRVGVAYAPNKTPVFATRSADGTAQGIPCDIGAALGRALGVRVEIIARATTGELTEAVVAGTMDIGFMPVDEARRQLMDFSPPYFVIQSTYMTTAASGVRTMAQIDHPGITVVGIDGSTTLRAAGRHLTQATLVGAPSISAAMAMMQAGQVQAIALTHESLPTLQKQMPGAHILDGAFQVTGVAVAVQKHKPEALAALSQFITDAKTNGIIRRAFADAGMGELEIAP